MYSQWFLKVPSITTVDPFHFLNKKASDWDRNPEHFFSRLVRIKRIESYPAICGRLEAAKPPVGSNLLRDTCNIFQHTS